MDDVLFNVLVNFISLVGYLYLAVVQIAELRRPKNVISPLRWIIFFVYTISIATLIPILMFQIGALAGNPSDTLRTIATVMSPTNRIATLILIIVFVKYKV